MGIYYGKTEARRGRKWKGWKFEPTVGGALFTQACFSRGTISGVASSWLKTRNLSPITVKIGKGRPWRREENSFLREYYLRLGPAICAKRLLRGRQAVVSHASKIPKREMLAALCLNCWCPYIPKWNGKGRTGCSKKCAARISYRRLRQRVGGNEMNRRSRETTRRLHFVLPKKFSKWSPKMASRVIEEYRTGRNSMSALARRFDVEKKTLRRALSVLCPSEFEAAAEAKRSYIERYRSGRNFEYRVLDELKGYGFVVAMSPRSRGPFDLTAIRTGEILLIQCKLDGKIPNREAAKLIAVALSIGAKPVLVWRGQGGSYRYQIQICDLRDRETKMTLEKFVRT